MGVFGTNPVAEAKADGYLRGQIWNRPTPAKEFLQLVIKTVTDESLPSPSRITCDFLISRATSVADWEIAGLGLDNYRPADPTSTVISPFGFDSNPIGSKTVRARIFDILAAKKSGMRYLVAVCSADNTTKSAFTPIPEYQADYSTFSIALGDKKISAGFPFLTQYLADINLYPTSAKKNLAALATPTLNKHFAFRSSGGSFFGDTRLWFAVELDLLAGNLAPRVIPNTLPSSLPLPPTNPPQSAAAMAAWGSYLAAGTPYDVILGADPSLVLAP